MTAETNLMLRRLSRDVLFSVRRRKWSAEMVYLLVREQVAHAISQDDVTEALEFNATKGWASWTVDEDTGVRLYQITTAGENKVLAD